jgi:hypothetical protein
VPGENGALPHIEVFGLKITAAVVMGLAVAYAYAGW